MPYFKEKKYKYQACLCGSEFIRTATWDFQNGKQICVCNKCRRDITKRIKEKQ